MTRPSPEYVVLQAELKRVENARKLEHDESEARQQLMAKQLQNEVTNAVLLMHVALFVKEMFTAVFFFFLKTTK